MRRPPAYFPENPDILKKKQCWRASSASRMERDKAGQDEGGGIVILYQAAKRLEASRAAGIRLQVPAGGLPEMEKWLLELASSEGEPENGAAAGGQAGETGSG